MGERLHLWMRELAAGRRDAGRRRQCQHGRPRAGLRRRWRDRHGRVQLHLVPAFLGGGRLFEGDGIATRGLEQVRVIEAPGVTHLTYRRVG